MTDLNEYLLIEQVEALKAQLAAVTAERDELRAKVAWLESSIDVFTTANREITFAFGLAEETCRKLEAERDSLRAEVERLQEKTRDIAWAALKYEDATYKVKTYKSNGQYQRQLKKIHDILKAALAEFGPEESPKGT